MSQKRRLHKKQNAGIVQLLEQKMAQKLVTILSRCDVSQNKLEAFIDTFILHVRQLILAIMKSNYLIKSNHLEAKI